MTKQQESQSLPIKAVSTVAKLATKDIKGTMIGILTVFCFIFLYGWHRAESRKDEVVDTYNVLIFSLVRQVDNNISDIKVIKTKTGVEDSLQTK